MRIVKYGLALGSKCITQSSYSGRLWSHMFCRGLSSIYATSIYLQKEMFLLPIVCCNSILCYLVFI